MGAIWEVDRVGAELTAKVEELRVALSAIFEEKMRELWELKAKFARDIPLALAEVERTLSEEQPKYTSQYAHLIRDCMQKSESLQLFTYTLDIDIPQIRLDLQVISPLQPATPARLAGVYNNQAFLYDVQAASLVTHALPVHFGWGGSYVEMDKNTLLCIGAFPASIAVYSLELSSFQLTSLPSLCAARAGAGVAKVNTHIYVFGGSDGKARLRSCEKLHIPPKCWTQFGSMIYPRCVFTPCHFQSLIYLLDANEAAYGKIETFEAETETFAVLAISLPPLLRLGFGSVAFVASGELCFLTQGKQLARWRIETDYGFSVFDTSECSWSHQHPLVLNNLVLIAYCGAVQQFSLETYSFI
jgi:hypothetical protein